MAQLSREALERARQISEKSDEEIGRWLAELVREPIEQAVRQVTEDRITQLYVMGALIDHYFENASRFNRGAPEALATWLALRGEYAKAGKAMRSSPGIVRVETARRQDTGRRKGQATAAERRKRKETEWQRVGLGIRGGESDDPMNDADLAKIIAKKCKKTVGGAANSVRLALPRLGLGRKNWLRPKPVKRRTRSAVRKKRRTFGTLRL